MKVRTISDFFETTGTDYRVFDMGRRIVRIPSREFQQFEQGQFSYPYPLQQQAWLGILGWDRASREQHFVWFLKFPLDESACLVQAARDDFLHQLLENIGQNIANKKGDELQDTLSNSPYGYKPRDDVMAVFHAKALKSMAKEPSRYFAHARDYLRGDTGYDQWAFVGIQGLADIAARLDEGDTESLVARAIPQLPPQPLRVLCNCLEHEPVTITIAEPLAERIRSELTLDNPDSSTIVSCLRALSHSKAVGLRRALLQELLAMSLFHKIDLLAAIAARCWLDLQEPEICRLFIEALANNPIGQEVFNQLMGDLMFIPGMRGSILAQLRDPDRSQAVTLAVEGMFKRQL